MPDNTLSTLTQIRTKVRRLTRSPSEAQLSTVQLDDYINTFVLYDFPEHLRLFDLRTTHTFYTQPFQDVYPTDVDSFVGIQTNPLYNFNNRFITVHEPIYIAGRRALFSQARDQFFNIYPFYNSLIDTQLRGDGVNTTFTGTITPPGGSTGTSLLQYNVTITSVNAGGIGMAMVDRPLVDNVTSGNNFPQGNLYQAGQVPALPPTATIVGNSIVYNTGQFTVTFPVAPANGEPIMADVRPVQPSLPQAMLYYDAQFILRPVPDDVYPVQFEAYIRPTELLAAPTMPMPELSQWWQYIAIGASLKIFEDRMDFESRNTIMQIFKEQEALVLRRTIVQNTNERVATIYTNMDGINGYQGWPDGSQF